MGHENDTGGSLHTEPARLHQEVAEPVGEGSPVRTAAAELQGRAAQLGTLHRMAAAIVSGQSAQEISRLVVQHLYSLFSPDFVICHTLYENRLLLVTMSPDCATSESLISLPRDREMGECLCGIAARCGRPIYCLDIRSDQRCTRSECKNAGVRSFAALPMATDEATVGVLGLASFEERDFSTAAPILEMIAAFAAEGVDKARRYEATLRAGTEAAAHLHGLKEAEEALRCEHELLSRIMETSPVGITVVNLEGRITFANSPAKKIFGLTRDEITRGYYNDGPWRITDLAGNAFPQDQLPFRRVIQTRKPVRDIDHAIEFPDGRRVLLRMSAGPLFTGSGDMDGIVAAVTDISEHKRVEGDLVNHVAMLESILEKAAEGICVCHTTSIKPFLRFTHWNSRMTQITGYSMDEINRLGWYATVFSDPEVQRKTVENLARMRDGDNIATVEWVITAKTGEQKPLLVSATVLKDAHGVIHVLALMRDLSEEKKARELQLQTARYRAVADLADGVAHTFNNLLQVILGNASFGLMNLDTKDYGEVRERFKEIIDGAKFGAETVRRLRSFVGIGVQGTTSEEEVFDLTDVAQQAHEMTRTWWETNPHKEGLEVSLTLNLTKGCLIRAKKDDIFQVLVNLIKNAAEALVKGGEILISAKPEREKVILQVSDTGIGIPQDNIGRIFTPFFTTNSEPGRGVGLPICRTIIRNLGGTIEVTSSEGGGTNVIVHLPLAGTLQQSNPSLTEKSDHRRLSIVVIDDVQELARMISVSLRKHNHSVFSACSGIEGLKLIKEYLPDAVICDLDMPTMNGWEVGKQVQEIFRARARSKPHFILLEDWSGRNVGGGNSIECGVDMVMQKPVDIPRLVRIITRLAGERRL